MTPTRALTLWPEWCVTFPGVRFLDGTPSLLDKRVENRKFAPWSAIAPRGGLVPEPGAWFAMHAGEEPSRAERARRLFTIATKAQTAGWATVAYHDRPGPIILRRDGIDVPLHPANIVTGAIVAVLRVIDVVPPGVGEAWRFPDQYGWNIEVHPLAAPIPCKGAQGLWTIPADVRARMEVSDV